MLEGCHYPEHRALTKWRSIFVFREKQSLKFELKPMSVDCFLGTRPLAILCAHATKTSLQGLLKIYACEILRHPSKVTQI